MDLKQAENIMIEVLSKTWNIKGKEVNLLNKGWRFTGFDRSVKRAGVCIGGRKEISLSRLLTENHSDDTVKNTILHEASHAVDNVIRGYSDHSREWKEVARAMGCDGERCYSEVPEAVKALTYKYEAFCPTHGSIGGWTRRPKAGQRRCGKCKSIITIKQNF